MAITYDLISSQTLASAASSITFSSIAASWTDLRLVLTGGITVAGSPTLRFNSDATTNYSITTLYGNGTSALSTSQTSTNKIALGDAGNSNVYLWTVDIFSYAGSTYKTTLGTSASDDNGSGQVSNIVGLWRSTSAITSLTINGSGNLKSGTTATLYGIKAA